MNNQKVTPIKKPQKKAPSKNIQIKKPAPIAKPIVRKKIKPQGKRGILLLPTAEEIKKEVQEELELMKDRIKELEFEFASLFPDYDPPIWWFPFVYLSCKFKFSPYEKNIVTGKDYHQMSIYNILGIRYNTVITYLCNHKDYRDWLTEKKLEALDLVKWNMEYMVNQAVLAMEDLLLYGPAPVRRDVAFKILEKYQFLDAEKTNINNTIHLPPTIQIITNKKKDEDDQG